jgi:hypothetical protein
MAFFNFLWTDEIVEHVAEHDVTQADFEFIVSNPIRRGISRSSGASGLGLYGRWSLHHRHLRGDR